MGEAIPKLRAMVVDDEAPARANIKALLRRHADIELIGEVDHGEAAVDAIRSHRPDLVFLDIQMPGCDGFDVLEMLGTDQPPAFIFVTAYDTHALKAFDVGALDYLLKPYGDDRFEMALLRAKEKLTTNRKPEERLVLKSAGQVLFLPVSDIDWIGAADYYASLHVGVRVHLMRRGLAELERDLDPSRFCRIHRSTIVNLCRVEAIALNPDGEHEAVLAGGDRLRVSRSYRKELMLRISALQSRSMRALL